MGGSFNDGFEESTRTTPEQFTENTLQRHYLTNPQKSDTITKRCKKNFGKNVTWGPNLTVTIRRKIDQRWNMVLVRDLGKDLDDGAEPF
ncbi:hypothetical protein MPER_12165 [Moniliophthora perniciosa FA553]|nr:hypothetical protein MPER_12165 [Moniliophthora perniciosa FA553]